MKALKYCLTALFVLLICSCANDKVRLRPVIDFGESATTLLKTETYQLVSDEDMSKSSNHESIGYLLQMRTLTFSNENCDTTTYFFLRNNLFCVSMKYSNMLAQDLKSRLEKLDGVEKHDDYYLWDNNLILLSDQPSCNGSYLMHFNNIDKEISKSISLMKKPGWGETQEDCDIYVQRMTKFNNCDVLMASWLMRLLGANMRGDTYYQRMLSY